jgi:hypothetical protein
MWTDPIVAEVRKAREALFAEANYDIHEFCRRLSERQVTSGHPIVKRSGVAPDGSHEEAVHPIPKKKLG